MTDEDKLRIGHNASISGYQTQWSRFLDFQPYDWDAYPAYVQLLEHMLPVLVEGSRILENPAWAKSIGNFRAAHTENLRRYTADLYYLRDRLPERGYDAIKRAILHLRHERARSPEDIRVDQAKSVPGAYVPKGQRGVHRQKSQVPQLRGD